MPHEDLLNDLGLWRELGWVRRLEEEFSRFLSRLDPAADELVLLAAALTSHQLGRGHVALPLAPCLADPQGFLGLPPAHDETPWAEAEPARRHGLALAALKRRLQALTSADLADLLSSSRLVDTGSSSGSAPLVFERGHLYLRRTWEAETAIAAAIGNRISTGQPSIAVAEVRSAIDEVFAPAPGAEPDWQRVACALTVRGPFTIVTGGPGTGKTWTAVRIIALLQRLHHLQSPQPLRIRLAAPTGKAAQRLTESISSGWQALQTAQRLDGLVAPQAASTLHRLLGSQYGTRRFRHDRANPLPADVVIVDEASMIDQELMKSLLDALDPATRLVLLGDKDQLASVEAGSVFGDLCRGADRLDYSAEVNGWLAQVLGHRVGPDGAGGPADQRVMLRRNRRSTAGIAELAEAVNAGDADGATRLLRDPSRAELGWAEPGNQPEAAFSALLGKGYLDCLEAIERSRPGVEAPGQEEIDVWARASLAACARFQVLTALREGPWGVVGLNRRIGEWLSQTRLGRSAAIGVGEWFHGRPVMMTRNDYATGLMNGDIGVCLTIPHAGHRHQRVVFPKADNELQYLSPARVRDVQTAWAMTVHKSQGSEFDHAVLVLPGQFSPVLTRELIYTGLTRARDRFTLVAPSLTVFCQAVRQRTRRSSALAERLGLSG
ncbi:MAG: exodeoxyribonuclease V subunit alpha [Wenzhouxiangella sp.]|jgi:exodeoxyribonuclease V alpha subunit|nr:exodeoxyribonuclease V subunit alpha [Wenzhouxiangella sp.]